MKNDKILYELSKKYVEDLGYKMPKFEEFKEYKDYDEYDELKTKCVTDEDGFLIDEYDYIKTERYLIDKGVRFSNEEIEEKEDFKIIKVFKIIISEIDFYLGIYRWDEYKYYDKKEDCWYWVDTKYLISKKIDFNIDEYDLQKKKGE